MFSSPSFSSAFSSSSSRTRNLDQPLIFNGDYGQVTKWYNRHSSSGSTTIHKIQLRKEHVAPPAYHEYILVLTRAGHTYRVDRGRDGPVFNTMKEQGVPPRDTIALLPLTSLNQMDGTSYCMIELCWDGDKTIDLLLILNICFHIHNSSGKRYKLLTHNCYFFSQTIIMIAVRKSVACRAELNEMFKGGITWKVTASGNISEVGIDLRSELGPELGPALGWALGWAVGEAVGEEMGWVLGEALGEVLGSELGQRLGGHVGWQMGHGLGQELGQQLGPVLGQKLRHPRQQLVRERQQQDLQERKQLEREQEWERERGQWEQQERGWDRGNWEQQERERKQQQAQEEEWKRDLDLNLGQAGCWNCWGNKKRKRLWKQQYELQQKQRELQQQQRELEQQRQRQRRQQWRQQRQESRRKRWHEWQRDWRDQTRKQLGEQLRMQLQELEPAWEPALAWALELAQGTLVLVLELVFNGELEQGWDKKCSKLHTLAPKTVPDKLISTWTKWLVENLGKLVIHQMKETSFKFFDSPFSKLVEFPASFSASSKINAEAPDVPIKTFKDLEEYVKGTIERHVDSVPPALGSREQLKAEILNGMTATWHLVSPQFQHSW